MVRVPLAIQPAAGNSDLGISVAAGPKSSLNKLNALNTPLNRGVFCTLDDTARGAQGNGSIFPTNSVARSEADYVGSSGLSGHRRCVRRSPLMTARPDIGLNNIRARLGANSPSPLMAIAAISEFDLERSWSEQSDPKPMTSRNG